MLVKHPKAASFLYSTSWNIYSVSWNIYSKSWNIHSVTWNKEVKQSKIFFYVHI